MWILQPFLNMLADAGFVTMEADLTDYNVEMFDELKRQGFHYDTHTRSLPCSWPPHRL